MGNVVDVAKNIWGGLKGGFNAITGFGHDFAKGYNSVFDFINQIPIVGDLIDIGKDLPIPFINQSVRDIENKVGNTFNRGENLGKTIIGVGDKIGLQKQPKKLKAITGYRSQRLQRI
jgi:hypothetical protein